MYRTVLVPLDGTAHGENALPVARGIARRCGAALHLVHVHTETAIPLAVESLPFLDAHIPLVPPDEQQAYLARIAATLTRDGLEVTTELVHGPLCESLARYAVERGADLVVACTHCHDGLSRFWHRGVGEQILRDVSVPILLNRSEHEDPDIQEDRSFRHILVPLNGSRFAEEILDCALPLARAFGARFTLLRVVRPMLMTGYSLLGADPHDNTFLLEEQVHEAETYLERVAQRLRAEHFEVRTRVVTSQEPGGAIVDATLHDEPPGTPPIDLIAMTTHCRGPLTRVVLSSITNEVLHSASVPLLLHHPQTGEAEVGVDLVGIGRQEQSTA